MHAGVGTQLRSVEVLYLQKIISFSKSGLDVDRIRDRHNDEAVSHTQHYIFQYNIVYKLFSSLFSKLKHHY